MARRIAQKPYHHGSLREALLRAVEELIAEKGIEGLSLRECARRAGASWSAPAHHFGDKTGMLTAFAAAGFRRLKEHMEERRDASSDLDTASVVSPPIGGVCFSLPSSSRRGAARGELRSAIGQANACPTSDEALTQQLSASYFEGRAVAVGEGYLEFALRNPGHFRIMFRAELLNKDDEEYRAASQAAFQVLEDAIREGDAATGDVDETTLHERCLLAWSVVHGFATLCLEGAIELPGRSAKLRLQAGLDLGGKIARLLGPSLFR
jgi:AcrR family transcriptional regulator